MSGESKRKIAREEKIDRGTVHRILSAREIVEIVAQSQSQILGMLPKAVRVLNKTLDGGDRRLALGAATKLMAFTEDLCKRGVEQTIARAQKETAKEDAANEIQHFGLMALEVWYVCRCKREPLSPALRWLEVVLEAEGVDFTKRPPGLEKPS